MTRLDDLAKPPAVRDAPGDPRAATPSSPIATWAWNVVLALLAVWPAARDRLPLVDRRTDEDLRKVLAHYKTNPPRIANVSLLLPTIEAGDLPRFLPLSWPSHAILSGCNEGD